MLKGVNMNRRKPQNWGVLRLHPLGMEGEADPKKQASPACVTC